MNRRELLKRAGQGLVASVTAGALAGCSTGGQAVSANRRQVGSQRLSLNRLKEWETWGYGLFACFGMSTFMEAGKYPPGQTPAAVYAPDRLDVDQWISVARDAGMRYAVLTAKGQNGHCLWPSRHCDYTVTQSGNRIDVVEKFVEACHKHDVLPGLYYVSMDNHHRFGSQTRDQAKRGFMPTFPKSQDEDLPPYTTSVYQTFMTAQVTELLSNYGPIAEMWIDLPGELGRGYRTFLYQHIAQLQPETFIMMNNGLPDSTRYDYHYAFPSDLLAIERGLPPEEGYQKWRSIEGKDYYMPGEICDPIGKNWYGRENDPPRADDVLLNMYQACRGRGANLLLAVPPDRHGLIPREHIAALTRLRENAEI